MSERIEFNRLDLIRAEHAEVLEHYKRSGLEPVPFREDINYLLAIISLLERTIENQAIAHLDPDNQDQS